ncbi:MAG: hypothetical protein SAJ12_22905 [Jaaginema sp. PMC 1079.18]|nr:hypothetical protein [Jaaginema sp. PMC 1080.18]MEC4853840.1 hypothetical protein [Jaaginema sp. PMC 1079.18]
MIAKLSCIVYTPLLTAVATFNPADANSDNTNSPAIGEPILFVKGVMKISWDECDVLTTTAGLTFELDQSEKG